MRYEYRLTWRDCKLCDKRTSQRYLRRNSQRRVNGELTVCHVYGWECIMCKHFEVLHIEPQRPPMMINYVTTRLIKKTLELNESVKN